MKMKMLRGIIALLGLVGIFAGVTLPATSASAHAINCTYAPYVPYKNGATYIKYGVAVRCNDAVDVRSMTIRLWQWSGSTGYRKVAETVSSSPAAIFSVGYNWACTPRGYTFQYHTEVIVDAFHGNWWRDLENSAVASLRC